MRSSGCERSSRNELPARGAFSSDGCAPPRATRPRRGRTRRLRRRHGDLRARRPFGYDEALPGHVALDAGPAEPPGELEHVRIVGFSDARNEVRYHVERSADWMIRLGDGTDESHARMQAALDALWMYTGEMFSVDSTERDLIDAGIAADVEALQAPWQSSTRAVLDEATLTVPDDQWMQGGRGRGGKQGVHTEHLSRLLAEMQTLPRSYPDASW